MKRICEFFPSPPRRNGAMGNAASAVALDRALAATAARLAASILVGCGLVSAGSSLFASTPPFSLDGERYDQSTFAGRFTKMLTTCDPTSLFASRARIERAVAILACAPSPPVSQVGGP